MSHELDRVLLHRRVRHRTGGRQTDHVWGDAKDALDLLDRHLPRTEHLRLLRVDASFCETRTTGQDTGSVCPAETFMCGLEPVDKVAGLFLVQVARVFDDARRC